MIIRNATNNDLNQMQEVYASARCFMRQTGNMNQWANNYPSDEILLNDIANGNSYVVLSDNQIVACFTFIIGEDPTYSYIEDGKWLNDLPYGTIHRIGSNQKEKGIFPFVLDYCFNKINNIRVDTHADNKVMQSIVTKNGFTYCGIIYLLNGDPRLAYQRIK